MSSSTSIYPFGGDAYLSTKHTDVFKAWADPKCGVIQTSDGDVPCREVSKLGAGGEEMVSLMSVSDARHNQTRRLVTQAFTVKAANDLAPRVEEVTNALIDAMEHKGPPADLFEDYAIQTPMTVICEMLGVPRDDEPLFREWGKVIVSNTMTAEEKQDRWKQLTAYLLPLVEQERQHPGNTVFGTLVKAYEKGDEVITQQEMLSFAAALIGAGFETVSTTFTNSAFILLQRPDLIAQLRERLDDSERLAIDLWLGPGQPGTNDSSQSIESCEGTVTHDSETIIMNPSTTHSVDTTPLYKNGVCSAKQYDQ